MFRVKTNLLLFLFVLVLAGLIAGQDLAIHDLKWLNNAILFLQNYESHSPTLAILLFCMAHLFCSIFAIPGGCTTLNISSGAVFGFLAGSLIVYPVTMLSAAIGYYLGSHFRRHRIVRQICDKFSNVLKSLGHADFLFLVTVRLSPVLPFGIVNLLCGAAHIKKSLYFSSTLVGIFFDVFFLNSLGATLSAQAQVSNQNNGYLIALFLILLFLFVGLRIIIKKRYGERLT